ncbi:MAG TPA: hypothetical protein VES03_00435 [Motilibacterales bacterium]|nr:hypothetical protein [Motilibacterales bacterium]
MLGRLALASGAAALVPTLLAPTLLGPSLLVPAGGVPDARVAASMPLPGLVGTADEVLCSFDTRELGEVSGIALSRAHEDTLWMTNDSGGGPLLYAIDITDCTIRATLTLLDTPARDHEALAIGRDDQGNDVIWVGDIGDNRESWPYARIHKVIEPAELADADVPVTTYRFTYPNGPANAEALMADPEREQLWVISKKDGVGGVYALPSPMSDSRTPMEVERVGRARSQVTDAAMAPQGSRFVVRDYLSAEVFTGTPPGQAEARFGLPLQPQGEAITWTADGKGLIVASERSGQLLRIDVPRTALGTDGGIAGALPRVAGFDIYPYVRIAAVALAALIALVVLRRSVRRRRRQRQR